MTYNKAFFVFFSGLLISFIVVFSMVAKMFFLKNIICGLVVFQIGLLGYLVGVTIMDIKKEKKCN